ncbi:hypothetical protein ES703_114408 [subsurface metagenome]
MKIINAFIFFLLTVCCAFADEPSNVLTFHGSSDASAAVALDGDKFIVADDENNVLRVYKIGSAPPLFAYDLTRFLSILPEYPEADIEGATKVGNRIYWITSHGRNRDGKIRPSRYRLFATDIIVENDKVSIEPAGNPSRTLVHNLLKEESVVEDDLARAAGFSTGKLKAKQRLKLAPKRDGLNIEALAAEPNGKLIYIGFRNPLHKNSSGTKKAIVITLKNPLKVIEEAQKPVFGKPLLWDLQALGIRAMEYSAFHKAFFIIAGPADEKKNFAFYKWSGDENQQPELIRKITDLPEDFTPEALSLFENSDKLFLLSDDGSLIVNVSSPAECMEDKLLEGLNCQNKHLTDTSKRTFRGFWLKP